MKSVVELASRENKPRLVPSFKQPERNLLSVFMSLFDLSPLVRSGFLKHCGYNSGRTCSYDSHMEASYSSPSLPDVRPDGLLTCRRGKSDWSAFVEAKAGQSPIRPEQILDYLQLASLLDVDAIITISNEFSRIPDETPYNISSSKKFKAKVYHFAWADIRTFLSLQQSDPHIGELEGRLLAECLEFFWQPSCGISTYDSMPPDWPKFVEASGTALGFGTKTQGITEIVHGWVQERRDLCSKMVHKIHDTVELGHHAGSRATADQRLKTDRKLLADEYKLTADYLFKASKAKMRVLAELRLCKSSLALEIVPPAGKKAKATVTWFVSSIQDTELSDATVSFDWKGKDHEVTLPVKDLISTPELASKNQKEAPRSIRIIRSIHDVRRFKSRKKFIENLEMLALSTLEEAKKVGWV
jgi:hypothetical protein